MNYSSEISGPTNQINNITQAIGPKDTSAIIQSNLTPFDQERDMIVGHMSNDYNNLTGLAIQNKGDIDSANMMKRYLKEAEGKNMVLQSGIETAKTDLKTSKQNLTIEHAKQKIVFEILGILGVTIVVYIVLGSSPYVHGVALGVLVLGIIYVLNYNAYRLQLLGLKLGSPTLESLGKALTPPSGTSWYPSSFFSAPNAPGP
jgi:hypothetical protein